MSTQSRREFMRNASGLLAAGTLGTGVAAAQTAKPNILFVIADDWSWPYASVHGTSGVQTPNFDRIAREGCLFQNAFTAAPQCSPNRAAILTGRPIWQLEEAGTHGSIFPKKHPVYPDLLEASGYHAGFTGKAWGPGNWELGGWPRNPAGREYNEHQLDSVPANGINPRDYAANFDAFLRDRPANAPFCFWCGMSEPHRRYEPGSGVKLGKRLEDAFVPPFLPDVAVTRNDILDYCVEIEWFDSQLGRVLERLEETGELDRTFIVVTSDNGMPFPSAKATCYEYGVHVPLAIRYPSRIAAGSRFDAPVSSIDFAPTYLELAGVPAPASVTGKSLLPRLTGTTAEQAHVVFGRERHTHARYDNLGYPSRAIRTADYLYIRNFKPTLWPAGDPDGYYDIDGGPSKSFMIEYCERYPAMFEQGFGKHPEEELFAIKHDPGCTKNLASESSYADTKMQLAESLMTQLREQDDPRVIGDGDIFDSYPRMSEMRPQLGGFAERGKYNPRYQGAN